jgi:hypothetical protein
MPPDTSESKTTGTGMIDWPSFSEDLYQCVRGALLRHFLAHSDKKFYAAAFHHVELDQAVPPLFGCQSDDNLPASAGAEQRIERWDCATWPPIPEVDEFLEQQMRMLREFQLQQTPAKWKTAVKQIEKQLINVCKRLSAELKRQCTNLSVDFAVLILDDDFRLTPKCVSRPQLFRMFPHLDAPRQRAMEIAGLPLEQQIAIHLQALGGQDSGESADAMSALQKIGPIAAPATARAMVAQATWRYAMLLDHYCVRSAEVIHALKVLALNHDKNSNWPECTLATLGEHEFLIRRPELSDETVTHALLHPLAWRHHHLDPLPLSYEPLELLMHVRPSSESVLLAEMERGSFADIRAKDLPVALAGAAHSFSGIRRHAAYVLSRTGLGRKNGPRIVAAVLPLLADVNPKVRYNALVTLDTWSASLPDDPIQFAQLAQNHAEESTRYFAKRILAALFQRQAIG